MPQVPAVISYFDCAVGGMHFRARVSHIGTASRHGGWIAWCARTPHLGDSPMDVDFAEDCWFEFGNSAQEAIAKLKREVLH